MALFDQILQNEKEVLQLEKILADHPFFYRKWKITNRLKKLELDQEKKLFQYLTSHDRVFDKYQQENRELLVTDEFICATSKEDFHILKQYPKELFGSIHDNGHLYVQTSKLSLTIFHMSYPGVLVGSINPLGETNLLVDKFHFSVKYGYRMPEKFRGKIDHEGKVRLVTYSTYRIPDGNSTIEKIIGDPFSGDEVKREKFLSNKEKMISRILSFQEEIRSSVM